MGKSFNDKSYMTHKSDTIPKKKVKHKKMEPYKRTTKM